MSRHLETDKQTDPLHNCRYTTRQYEYTKKLKNNLVKWTKLHWVNETSARYTQFECGAEHTPAEQSRFDLNKR